MPFFASNRIICRKHWDFTPTPVLAYDLQASFQLILFPGIQEAGESVDS